MTKEQLKDLINQSQTLDEKEKSQWVEIANSLNETQMGKMADIFNKEKEMMDKINSDADMKKKKVDEEIMNELLIIKNEKIPALAKMADDECKKQDTNLADQILKTNNIS